VRELLREKERQGKAEKGRERERRRYRERERERERIFYEASLHLKFAYLSCPTPSHSSKLPSSNQFNKRNKCCFKKILF